MSFKHPEPRASHHPARALTRAHMPTGFDISLADYTDGRTVRIPDDFGPAQKLEGFDPEYRNIVDYIVRITYKIWETDKAGVEYILDCYAPDSLVFDDYGLQRGNERIVGDTHHTTGAFEDIILDAEEVIWAGDDTVGFHTSHRTRILGTNTGDSRYGPATGAKVDVLVIANCVALGNDIFLEHVLYNTSAMLMQLGLDPWAEAERLAADPQSGWPRTAEVWDALREGARPAKPLSEAEPVNGFDPDSFARAVHDDIWNGDGARIDTDYAEDLPFEGTSTRAFTGRDAYRAYVAELRAAFPDLALQVDEVYWMGNETDGYLVSTRWSAEATHSGGTLYREPTGAHCQIWGITQWEVRDGRVMREWQLFNEFDLMMQIAKARHDAN
ncbi:ester cyclase [Sulfitobacter sp. D35]|uniref:nuclear transport factor 2 family protein n=1 Tax=Sulfitobacter sp. D35 TaxID=3083252 RepID=UPI00296E8B2A|nr:ester cyclase [Sulfitobacter sp. D35]MDW4499314.1 ester cyclase [Sulfitobacter sp. D35]